MPAELAPVLVFSLVGLLAFFVRGMTGAASAIVANACFLVLLTGGSPGELTLLDALYWIALVDVAATLMLAWPIRHQLVLDPIARRFLAGTVPVNVAFTLLLPRIDITVLGLGLGIAVMAAGVYLAARRAAPVLAEGRMRPWATPVGASAGVLGGLYGMGGPVGILFFSRLEHSPTRFRARVTSIFVITGSIRLLVLVLAGSYTPQLLGWGLASLPAVALGLALGFRVHRHVEPVQFRLILGLLVALAGFVGALRAIAG